MADTQELLAAFVRERSEPAFRELVLRYMDLVYSTALRLVDGDAHRAEDVSQVVFTDLAKMADRLTANTTLGGWLHRHTCFVARTTLRGERRRQARERQAVEMNALNDDNGLARIAPILDEAIQELGPDDRDAILLRFFERRNLRSVGEALGINENVAQKRVAQAVHELEKLLRRRGVALSSAMLAGALAAGAVKAAPAGLAASIAASAWSGVTMAGGAGVTAAKVAVAAKIKIAIFAAVATLVVVTAVLLRDQSKATAQSVSDGAQAQFEAADSAVSLGESPAQEETSAISPGKSLRSASPPTPQINRANAAAIATPADRGAIPSSNSTALLASSAGQVFGARSGSKVRIEGTSNIHDWQVEGSFIGGTLEIEPVFAAAPTQAMRPGPISARAEVFIPVASLKSVDPHGIPYSDNMDSIMHDALDAHHHPKIVFRLSQMWLTGTTNYHNVPRSDFDAKGELAIAGVTNKITMPFSVEAAGKDRYKLSGETRLKMSSFGIDASATTRALGLVKPGDDIRVLVEWVVAAKGVPGGHAAAQKVPLVLTLPTPVFNRIPRIPAGKQVEPISAQPRAPLLVPPGLINIASGSILSCSAKNTSADTLAAITDGDKSASDRSIVVLPRGSQWVQMDFGSSQEIYAIVIWHAYDLAKIYHDVIVQSSDDKAFSRNVRTLFNNDRTNASGRGAGRDREYVETYEGKLIDANGAKARYLRFYSKGSTESALNEYTEIEVYGRPAE